MPSIFIGCKELIVWSEGILIKRECGQRFIVKNTITQIILDESDSCIKTIVAIVDNKEQVPLAVFYNKNDGSPQDTYKFILENLYSPPA